MCSGRIGIGSSGSTAFGFDELQHHGRVVGSRDGLHRRQVGAPVAGLRTAVDDPVVGVGDVARGQRLAVGPRRRPRGCRRSRSARPRTSPTTSRAPAPATCPPWSSRPCSRTSAPTSRTTCAWKPLNGLNESTSSRNATVKVTGSSSAAPAGCIESARRRRAPRPASVPTSLPPTRADGSTVPSVTTPPPQAPREPYEHVEHGVVRADPYHWMRRTDDPVLLAHLEAERLWYDTATGHLNSLVETLRSEMLGRVPATDRSVSWRLQGCSYYTALPAGREHHQLLRERNDSERHSGPRCSSTSTTWPTTRGTSSWGCPWSAPTRSWLAYSVDRTGDEVYELRFRDLETGADLPEVAPRTYYGGAWSSGSDHFFYTVHDDAYRPFQVWRHALGTPVADDVLVLEEPDERFELNVRATRSGGPGRDLGGEPRHPGGVGGRRRVPDVAAALGRRPAPGHRVPRRARACSPTARTRCCWSPTTTPPSSGSPAARCPATSDQDHTSWAPARAERPDERLERVDGFAGHAVLSFRSETRAPAARRCRSTPWTPTAS